jgi:hypothetical protein
MQRVTTQLDLGFHVCTVLPDLQVVPSPTLPTRPFPYFGRVRGGIDSWNFVGAKYEIKNKYLPAPIQYCKLSNVLEELGFK